MGVDFHYVDATGSTRNGYYVAPDKPTPYISPAMSLGFPELTLYNPDSFSELAQEFAMRERGWATYVDAQGYFRYRRLPAGDPSVPPRELVDWPKNVPSEWSNQPTDMRYLPPAMVNPAGFAKRDSQDSQDESLPALTHNVSTEADIEASWES